jgi:vacuolar-type H+-ATPase subunit I/STV1
MKKVSFEMSDGDFENLLDILRDYVVKHKYEIPTDSSYSKEQVKWHSEHADYVQKNIINKIIQGVFK